MWRGWPRAAAVVVCALVCLVARADEPPRGRGGQQGPLENTLNAKLPHRAAVGTYILGPTVLVAGIVASYRVSVHWATAPRISGPLPGAKVVMSLVNKSNRRVLAECMTDRTGNARFRFTVPRVKTGDDHQLQVQVNSRLGSTIQTSRVDIIPDGQLLVTTDKNIYQPSQTIHLRAMALGGMDLRPVQRRPVQIRIKDPLGNVVFSQTKQTSRFGVASADFALAGEINLGSYTIEARVEGAGEHARSTRRVEVKRYTLPRYALSIETERKYYRPGEVVRGTVRGRYFFGKPLAGATASLSYYSSAWTGGGATGLNILAQTKDCSRGCGCLDRQGRCTFEIKLDRYSDPVGEGEVRLVADVTDSAGHEQSADLSVPLTSHPLRLAVVPENSRLVPGVANRLHVVAGYPDGAVAVGASVTLRAGRRAYSGRTDSLGVATFSLYPRRNHRVDEEQQEEDVTGGMKLRVRATDRLGQIGAETRVLPVAARESVVVRPAWSLVPPGREVKVTLLGGRAPQLASNDKVYLDLIKDGQTLATHAAVMRRGRGTVRFTPGDALFGLLELRGYRLSSNGKRVGTSRMIYVERPGRLRIEARADRSVYRPGGQARIRIQVTDSRSGKGVQAALGLVALDAAAVALGALQQSSPRVFFTLASQLSEDDPVRELRSRPGGQNLSHWLGDTDARAAHRRRAADVLLAAVWPTEVDLWETNPWRERHRDWEDRAPELIEAARKFVFSHSVGRRTARGWRFARDLIPRMVRAGVITGDQARDPWKRTVRPWHLRRVDATFNFSAAAAAVAPVKLDEIYVALEKVWKKLNLPREKVPTLARRKWPLVLPRDLLAQLVKMGALKPQVVVDPWGQSFLVRCRARRFVDPYGTGLVSRYIVYSRGPDGVSGTRDDINPPGRISIAAIFGRRSALGEDSANAVDGLLDDRIGETSGEGRMGRLRGYDGRGGGGAGASIGYGSLGTISAGNHRSGGGSVGMDMPARVRSRFPETLLWRPELITDRAGRATLDLELADSITTWRLLATGSSAGGLLGSASTRLRVFQDFFVDLDLPDSLTQGDRVSLPVTVYNYLKKPQKITLRLRHEAWFTAAGPKEQTITLGPSQVGVRHFPIVARRVGRQDLTILAHSVGPGGKAAMADAVRRTVQVYPDGVEHATSHGGTLRPSSTASHDLKIPATVIDGTLDLRLAVYAGPLSQAQGGLAGMLRMPGGCFEQTSSTTYPNVLVLDYLRRAGKSTPALERRARDYINAGYQRLVSFEVPGGGFSWFGNAPADAALTAYGLMEFFDMARVHPVDPGLIRRTQRWLARQQRKDGSWPDTVLPGVAKHRARQRLRITAYISDALRRSGYGGTAVKRALGYVGRNAARGKDAYTLALLANLLARDDHEVARDVRRRLWTLRRPTSTGLQFQGPDASLTHGAGISGRIETTALAALAFLASPAPPAHTSRLVDALVASRDPRGSWHSTQATILSLRALLTQHHKQRLISGGAVAVLVDGRARGSVTLDPRQDITRSLDLTPFVGAGRHRVILRFSGTGEVQYHLVGRYWLPREEHRARARVRASLSIATTFHPSKRIKVSHPVRLDVTVGNRGRASVPMPLVSLALPPGFAVQERDFTRLVDSRVVSKVQRLGDRAILYLTRLGANKTLSFSVGLRGKYPLRVQSRPAVVYEYYRPENRARSSAHLLEVR